MSSEAAAGNTIEALGVIPRAVIPTGAFPGVVSGRVCEACGGPVWWQVDEYICSVCRSGDYRMRDLPRLPESCGLQRRAALTEPEWAGGFRGQVGKLLWARGLHQKAIRFLNCKKLGRPGVCSNYPHEHKFFVPHGCEVVFCKECADEARRALLIDYWHVVCNAILDFAEERAEHERLCELIEKSSGQERQSIERQLGELWTRVGQRIRERGWVLARITFTVRSDGGEITPDEIKAINKCVGMVMRRTVGSRKGFGILFVDEVGFEKRGHLPDELRIAHGLNPHVHGIYFGPRLDWERTRDLWMEVTKKSVGTESRGFFITAVKRFAENPGRAIRWALNHMFKYVSKPPAVTPERLAALIAAFDGAKRVHSLGLFYGKKPKRERKDCPCPKCRAEGITSSISFEGSALPDGGCIPRLVLIEDLRKQGYEPLCGDGRTTNFGDVPLERLGSGSP
jgi:hypothetical protein